MPASVSACGPLAPARAPRCACCWVCLSPRARGQLLGLPIPARAREARARIGVVPQTDALDPDFSVAENLMVFGRYFGMRSADIARRIPDLLDFAGLGGKRDAKIGELSGGMKRRLTLARALVNDPEILFPGGVHRRRAWTLRRGI